MSSSTASPSRSRAAGKPGERRAVTAAPRTGSVVIVLGLLLTRCGAESPPTSPPGAQSPPAASSSEGARGRIDGIIEVSAVVQVIADELRLRADPNTTAALVAAMPSGHVARIEAGPVEAEGFRWWQLVDVGGRTGWAADGDGTDAWLTAAVATDAPPLIRLHYGCDVTGPIRVPATTILTDGTVILTDTGFAPGDPAPAMWRIGTLSAAGLEHIRGNLVESPYLQVSAEYVAEPLPGATPPGHGGCVYEFTVGGDEVAVTAVGWFGDEEEAAFWQPSPQRKTLTDFAQGLIALDDVLDDALWATPPTLPYLATRYTVVRTESPAGVPVQSGTPRLAEDPLGDLIGEPARLTGIGACWEIAVGDAFRVATVLADAEPPLPFHAMGGPAYVVDATNVGLIVVPQTPVGEPSCADVAG